MDSVEQHRSYAPRRLVFALLTVSDSRALDQDRSGDRMSELAEAEGHRVAERRLVRDDRQAVGAALRELLAGQIDVVVVSGGTGFSPRDVTVEAVRPLLERELEGFGELFRMLSWEQVGAAAMLSRALAGVAGRRAVFVLPGSPKAVELGMTRLILPEAAHLVAQLRR